MGKAQVYCHNVVPWCFFIVICEIPDLPALAWRPFLILFNRKRCRVLLSFLTALQSHVLQYSRNFPPNDVYKEMGWVMGMWALH